MTEETVSRGQPTAVAIARQYPVEQAFFQPLILGAILVLIPVLLIHFFLDVETMHRLMKILFGNWISPLILWFFVASLMHLWMKRARLVTEQQQTEVVAKRALPSVLSETIASTESRGILAGLQQNLSGNKVTHDNLLLTRLR